MSFRLSESNGETLISVSPVVPDTNADEAPESSIENLSDVTVPRKVDAPEPSMSANVSTSPVTIPL